MSDKRDIDDTLLGAIIVREYGVAPDLLQCALVLQREAGGRIGGRLVGEILVDLTAITSTQLMRALEIQRRMRTSRDTDTIDPFTRKLVARKLREAVDGMLSENDVDADIAVDRAWSSAVRDTPALAGHLDVLEELREYAWDLQYGDEQSTG